MVFDQYGTRAGFHQELHPTLRNFIAALPLKDQTSMVTSPYKTWMEGAPYKVDKSASYQLSLFKDAIRRYTGTASTPMSDIIYNLIKGKHTTTTYNEDLTEQARMLVSAVREGPVFDDPLYRGIMLSKEHPALGKLMSIKPGDVVEMPGIKSFTTSPFTAQSFATGGGNTHPIMFVVVGAKRGLPVDVISSNRGESEVITFGKFRVMDVHDEPNENYESTVGNYDYMNRNDPYAQKGKDIFHHTTRKIFISQYGTF